MTLKTSSIFTKNVLKKHIVFNYWCYSHKIRDEKLQHDINKKAAKIAALSSQKIDKYEYLTGEEILPSNQRQTVEQAKFAYLPSGKVLENEQENRLML